MLAASEFRINSLQCKSCVSVKQKLWGHNNINEIKKQRKKYNSTYKARVLRRLAHLKIKCKKLGIPYNICIGDIVIPNYCPALGVVLNNDPKSPNCATIDRLIPKLGYIKDNIVIVSKRANQIKSDANLEEIKDVLYFYSQIL